MLACQYCMKIFKMPPKKDRKAEEPYSGPKRLANGEEDASAPPKKRTRGRPRKKVSTAVFETQMNIDVAAGNTEAVARSSAQAEVAAADETRVSNDKVVMTGKEETVAMPSVPPQKRTRGRPRKAASTPVAETPVKNDEVELIGKEETVARTRGRRKREASTPVTETQVNNDEAEMTGKKETVTRTVRRARKAAAPAAEKQVNNDEAELSGTIDTHEKKDSLPGSKKGKKLSAAKKRKEAGSKKRPEEENEPSTSSGQPATKVDPCPIAEKGMSADRLAEVWTEQLEKQYFAQCPSCQLTRKALESIQRHYSSCQSKSEETIKSEQEDKLEYARLKKEFKVKKSLKCKKEGCAKVFTTLLGYLYHRDKCGETIVTESFECELCDKKYTTKPGLSYHYKKQHPTEFGMKNGVREDELSAPPPRQAAIQAGEKMQNIIKLIAGNHAETEIEKNDNEKKKQSESEDDGTISDTRYSESDSCGASSEMDWTDDEEYPRRRNGDETRFSKKKSVQLLTSALAWTREQREKLVTDDALFATWMPRPSDWTLLQDQKEANKYEPETKSSVLFAIKEDSQDEGQPETLALYQARPSVAGNATFFVGGPVWAMDWCPQPLDAPASAWQYAAISCHPDMDTTYPLGQSHSGKGLIQLWCFGRLAQNKSSEDEDGDGTPPYLSLAIAHDYGLVRDLKWCPSGVWQDPAPVQDDSLDAANPWPRLGLLAVACSDSRVRILSLPHPQSLLPADDTGSAGTFIANSVEVLQPTLDPEVERFGQCLTVCWQPTTGHSRLLAGFSNGVVALWDLETRSGLLRVAASQGAPLLLPYHSFVPCGGQAVRSVSWCPSCHDFVACCAGRFVSVWNLADTTHPVYQRYWRVVTDSSWLSHAFGIFYTEDDSFWRNYTQGTGLHYIDYDTQGRKRGLISPNYHSTAWSVDSCDWTNSVVVGTHSGQVIVSILPDLCHKGLGHIKSCRIQTPAIYSTELRSINASENRTAQPGEGQIADRSGADTGESSSKVEIGKEVPTKPLSYQEASRGYYLVFHDHSWTLNKLNQATKQEREAEIKQAKLDAVKQERLSVRPGVDRFPLESIHKVCWNPNSEYYIWCLSGGQHGLVRLHRLSQLVCDS